MHRFRLVLLVAPLLLTAAATAREPRPFPAAAALPAAAGSADATGGSGGDVGPLGTPLALPTAGDSITFQNLDFRQLYFSGEPGVMFAEDLHLVVAGRLTNFVVGIFKERQTPPAQAAFYFFENNANDAGVGSLLAGPYTIGLSSGARQYHVSATDSAQIGQHVWLAVRLSSIDAGLMLANQPSVGTSHDLYWDFVSGVSTVRDPPANFYMEVRVLPDVVGVEPVTWSGIKAMYAAPATKAAARGRGRP